MLKELKLMRKCRKLMLMAIFLAFCSLGFSKEVTEMSSNNKIESEKSSQNVGNNNVIQEIINSIPSSKANKRKSDYEAKLISKMKIVEKRIQDKMDNSSSSLEVKEAIGELDKKWDDELNKVYKLVMAKLPANLKTKLRNSQREWIQYRDKEAEEESRETGSVEAYGDTTTKLTKEKTIQLAKLYDSLKN
jgi:hypothetical protein